MYEYTTSLESLFWAYGQNQWSFNGPATFLSKQQHIEVLCGHITQLFGWQSRNFRCHYPKSCCFISWIKHCSEPFKALSSDFAMVQVFGSVFEILLKRRTLTIMYRCWSFHVLFYSRLLLTTSRRFNLIWYTRTLYPLVEPLFTGLLALHRGPNRQSRSDLIVELCPDESS